MPYATNSSGPLCREPLYRAVKIFNFFIFQYFQKISSRGPSPICPMSPTGPKIEIYPAILESIGVKPQDSPSLCNPIPKARSLRSLAFDYEDQTPTCGDVQRQPLRRLRPGEHLPGALEELQLFVGRVGGARGLGLAA